MDHADWGSGGEVVAFAVTTRSRLKGLRYFPLMFVASMQVRRQLARTPGLVRWASVISGPREFWTFTVWSSKDRMIEFMGSGAHESIMWLFGKWLRSFWLTRWRPTTAAGGHWDGSSLAADDRPHARPDKTPEQQAALDAALAAFPRLQASVGVDGAATLDTAAFTRHRERSVAGIGAVIVRLTTPDMRRILALWRAMRQLRDDLDDHPDVVRRAVGLATPREAFALVVFGDLQTADGFPDSPIMQALQQQWPDGVWWMRWDAANEFGHWDGVRVRQQRHQHHA